MEDDSTDGPPSRPESLLPYDLWTEDALRQVVSAALDFAGKNGLPGEHHFYVSFRTDARGVIVPQRLLSQYPHEMTIVLQHQFWDLTVDDAARTFSVGLSFGGIPTTLTVPFAAVTGFADPHVQFGLRFRPPEEEAANDEAPEAAPETGAGLGGAGLGGAGLGGEAEAEAPPPSSEPQVVSLDAFRKRTTRED